MGFNSTFKDLILHWLRATASACEDGNEKLALETLHFVYGLTGYRQECTDQAIGWTFRDSISAGERVIYFFQYVRPVLWPTDPSI